MDPLNVYDQYFKAECEADGITRRAVLVALVAESSNRQIRYYIFLNFIPHEDPEDYRLTCDAYWEKVIYDAPGRRSKKREKEIMTTFREKADAIASEHNAKIFWDRPLREARRA